MRQAWIALCVAVWLLAGGVGQAALLVDTGPGGTSSIGSPSLFDSPAHFQYLGGRFTLASPATLSSVEGWMVGGSGGMQVKVRADGAVPGSAIYSKTYTLGTLFPAPGWEVFSAFNATLPAGTYWLCFEPVVGGNLNRSMPIGATAPLPSYAYLGDGNPGWLQLLPNPGLGIRVSGGPVVIAPLGSAVRGILDAPFSDFDILAGGEGELETFDGAIDFSGYGWSLGRGAIYANWLECGSEAVSSQAHNATRSVAWRSFQNTTAGALTLRLNATLDGGFDSPFGTVTMKGWSGIHALDATQFASAIAASGKTTQDFLLGGNALNGITGAADRLSLSTLFPVAARLGSDVKTVLYSAAPVVVSMQTGLFTVAPNQVFTLLFDVTALSQGTGFGGTLFLNTLQPAAVPFTNAGGGPVSGIQALGDSITVGEPNFLMWYDQEYAEWLPALNATSYRLYRGTGASLPNLLTGATDACLRYQDVDVSASPLDEIPPVGTFYWYLAVGVNGATEGAAGAATSGPRVLNSSGACPLD